MRRIVIVSLMAGSASVAHSQYWAAERAVAAVADRERLPIIGRTPLQPTGFPGPPPRTQTLPPGAKEPIALKIEHAGVGGRDGNDITIREGAEFWYRGYHIFADTVDGNLQTNIFTMRGNVKVLGQDSVIIGERVTVNFENNTYLANNADTQLSPTILKGNVRDDVYVQAKESFGSEREIWSHDGDITTCNLDEPHYHIEVKDSDIRRGKRAILRHTKVVLFGRTLLNIPYMSIPLDDPRNRYTPEVGQSEDEGYYVKSRWGIPLRGENQLDSRVDYMTKLGLGLGGDYRYFNRDMNGLLKVYKIYGAGDTFTLSNDHRQEFKFGTLTVNTNYQNNNYLTAPGSTLWTSRVQLALPVRANDTTRINYAQTSSTSSGFETGSKTISLSNQHSYGPKTRSTIDINWQNNSTSYTDTSTDTTQMNVRAQASHDFNAATANFEYLRTIPVGDGQNVFNSGDRTPFFSLTSDSRRLVGDRFGQVWPITGELSFGEFSNYNGTDTGQVDRYNLDLRLNRPDRSGKRFRVDVAGQFRQGFYSDDTAQYSNALNATASYRLGRDTSANLRYNYTRAHGFSPVSIDYTGRTNLVSADLTYRPWNQLLLGAQTGYDLVRLDQQDTAWNQVGLRTEYMPRQNVLFRTYSNYDTFQRQWSNLRLDLAYRHNDQFIAIGAQYDGINKAWSNANLYLQNFVFGRTKWSALFTYNGYTKEFDSMQLNLIYDLHCAEAIFAYTQSNTGFRAGTQLAFFIRLKALPFDVPFGFGTQGQPLTTPVGFGN